MTDFLLRCQNGFLEKMEELNNPNLTEQEKTSLLSYANLFKSAYNDMKEVNISEQPLKLILKLNSSMTISLPIINITHISSISVSNSTPYSIGIRCTNGDYNNWKYEDKTSFDKDLDELLYHYNKYVLLKNKI